MSHPGMADFLEGLGQSGQLVRVAAEVDSALEVAEITRRAARTGGPALLFGAVKGRHFPVITNLLGTESRVCRALRVKSVAEAAERIAALTQPTAPGGWFERLAAGSAQGGLRKLCPKTVRSGPCQQVVALGRDVSLDDLPILQCWPEETGPTLTAARVHACDPDSGRPWVARYDLRVLDRNRLVAGWHDHDEPARWLAQHKLRGEPLPLAIAVGGDPADLLAAMAPAPADVDRSCLAGLLRGRPVEVVKCRTVDLEAPADAEIVIEGFIDPAEAPTATGPLGLSNGFYQRSRLGPVIHVTAVTHRANPICQAMVPGPPPDEHCVIAQTLQQVFVPLVKAAIPELVDWWFPNFGAARHWGLVSIRKTYPGQARRVAHALWGMPHLMFTKFWVIVDEGVELRDPDQVWLAVAAHAEAGADINFHQGPRDPWDPASGAGELAWGTAIDATAKLPGEYQGDRPGATVTSDQICRLVEGRWEQYGLPAR